MKLFVRKGRSPYQVLNSELHKQELYSFYRNIWLRSFCRARNVSESWNSVVSYIPFHVRFIFCTAVPNSP